MSTHYLRKLFNPSSVAVFGASPRAGSIGGVVYRNMTTGGFKGPVLPVNPKRGEIDGQPCFADLEAAGQPVDLAVIAAPAPAVPAILEDCGRHRVPAAVVLSAGFREIGEEGRRLEERVLRIARRHGIRFVGPNCLGIMQPGTGLNATFFKGHGRPGHVALVSQSGAVCASILDWADTHEIGFSHVVSAGIAADVDIGEILDYLTLDPGTRSILLYVEGIRNARRFMSGVRSAARLKPVIALKVGRSRTGSRAAMSHTGAIVGADEVFGAALRRAGVVRVDTFGQLFAAAETLSFGKPARGERLAIVTNGGGPGVLATDAAARLDLPLAELSPETMQRLDACLPSTWSRGNPVDIIGDADDERYRAALRVVLQADEVDGVLVMLTPTALAQPLECARAVIETARETSKPVLASWVGGTQVAEANREFIKARIPAFAEPVAAVEAFSYLVSHNVNQRMLLETPGPLTDAKPPDKIGAEMIIEGARKDGREVLALGESKALLSAFRIPVTPSIPARSAHEALIAAEEIGLPVVMKIMSPGISHKSDVQGVRLNLRDAHAVRAAYQEMTESVRARMPDAEIEGVTVEKMVVAPHGRELMIGAIKDPAFGPAIHFGLGGTMVEVVGDHVAGLPPLNEVIIERMIARTRAAAVLGEFRGQPPVNRERLMQVLMRVSEMVCELPWIEELDLNPVIADEEGVTVVDARIVIDRRVHPIPYAHMAIHPYPSGLSRTWQLADGTEIVIRPIRPEDARIEKHFADNLSERSKYFRFMGATNELSQEMLVRFTQIDYDREMAFIATTGRGAGERQIAVGRTMTYADGESCEFALVVADEWQRKGIGRQIMEDLIRVARGRGLRAMRGDILAINRPMIRLVERLGFVVQPVADDGAVVTATKDLRA